MRNIYLLGIFMLLCWGCSTNTASNKETISFSESVKSFVEAGKYDLKHPYIVYYYNGSCSLCYANIMNITNKLPKVPMIVVTPSQDTVAINAYMSQIGYTGKVCIDTDTSFFKLNKNLLAQSSLLLVDPSQRVLAQSANIFDEKTFELFKQQLEH